MAALARKIVVHFVTAFALLASLVPAPVAAQSLLGEPRYASVMIDAGSGEVVYAQRADSPRYPASITKMMTLYLAFEALEAGRLSLDDTVLMSPRAAAQPPSRLGLRAGDTLTVRDAIFALAIKSANDVAVALAERIGGTESRFATLMTLKAQELGMRRTRYVNASGLPDSRQLSSARDIAVLSRALMRDFPQHYTTFSTRTWTFRGRQMNNHNRLLFQMAGVDGIKTGFTNASGYNLAASAVRGRRRLIAVVLGGPSGRARDAQTRQLLETGFGLMARRDAGEPIQFAANLFETPNAAPPVGSVIQGSANEEDGEDPVAAILRSPVRATGRVAGTIPTARSAMSPIMEAGDRESARAAAPVPAMRVAMAPVANPPEPSPADIARAEARRRAEQEAAAERRARREEERRARLAAAQDDEDQRPATRRGRDRREAREDDERPTRLARREDERPGRRGEDEDRDTRRGRRGEEERPTRQASRESGNFVVQVGAFGSHDDARARLGELRGRFRGAESAVTRASGGQWRARFNGLSESQARAACRAVRGPCMVVGGA